MESQEIKMEENLKKVPSKKLGRRKLREEVFKLLFSFEFIPLSENISKESKENKITQKLLEKAEIFLEIENITNKEDREYILKIVNEYIDNHEYIVTIIKENLKQGWEISRITKASKALIKLAVVEIKYMEIGYKIVINEIVELSKNYQEEKDTKFVNGILAKFIAEGLLKVEKDSSIENDLLELL